MSGTAKLNSIFIASFGHASPEEVFFMKRKTAAAVISILSAAVLVLAVVATVHVRRSRRLEYYARMSTQRAFSELVGDVSALSDDLEKCVYISDAALQSALCTQVYGKALEAQMALGELPYEAQALEQAAGFLSRVGDYACVLSRSVGQNGGYSSEELENLQSLAETAGVMAGNLRELEMQLANGTMTMDTALLEAAPQEDAVLLSDSISDIENEFPELPTLIYDGPFSDAIRSDDPKLLHGMQAVDEEQARSVAAQMLGMNEAVLESAGECGGDVPCWCFCASVTGGEYAVSVTKRGGVVWSVLSSHRVQQERYSVADALKIAQNLLAEAGMDGMETSYHIVQDGVLTVNFAYRQEDTLCYADLIKVGIALDTGSLQSYDASGYIRSHHERTLSAVAVDAQQAQSALAAALKVQSHGMALIPTDGGGETLCHEFLCTTDSGRRCLIYVNALSGNEERILLLLEDEAGTLTI